MQYNPDDYEPQDFTPAKPGIYDFVVISAEEKESKAGNEMISVELQVTIPGRDNPIKVYDYLVSTPAALFKIDQFCKAVGIDFSNGILDVDDCLGAEGRAVFCLGDKKDDGKQYLAVDRYEKAEGYTEQPVGKKPTGRKSTAKKTTTTRRQPAETVADDEMNDAIDYPDDDIPF